MGKAAIEYTEDGTIIRCVRGPISKMNIILKNKNGEEFFSPLKRDLFDLLPAGRPVEAFDKKGLNPRKFLKEYLEFVSNTAWNK
jgi:hypothetical protein